MNDMTHVPEQVVTLERSLREIFGARLRSFVVYGLHASLSTASHPHDHQDRRAPVRTMALAESLTRDHLRRCADRIERWHAQGLATPLLLAVHELARSLDAFPLEFGSILADYSVLSGANPFDGLRLNPEDVRRACEVQARSHLLHLREGFLETQHNGDALAVLIVRSAAPFAGLLAGIARLQGLSAGDAAAAGRHAERTLQLPPGVVTDIVKLAHVTEISSAEAVRVFPAYLDATERLVAYVDGWSAR